MLPRTLKRAEEILKKNCMPVAGTPTCAEYVNSRRSRVSQPRVFIMIILSTRSKFLRATIYTVEEGRVLRLEKRSISSQRFRTTTAALYHLYTRALPTRFPSFPPNIDEKRKSRQKHHDSNALDVNYTPRGQCT